MGLVLKTPQAVYLETSVLAVYYADDDSGRREATRKLLEEIRQERYGGLVAYPLLQELAVAGEEDRTRLTDLLRKYPIQVWPETDEVEQLAGIYLRQDVFTEEAYQEAVHVASAVVAGTDALLSWDHLRLVNFSVRKGVNAVNRDKGYGPLDLCTPFEVISYEA